MKNGVATLERARVRSNLKRISPVSPWDSGRTWQLPVAKKSEIASARATAGEAASRWRELAQGERLKALQDFGHVLQQRETELIELLVDDIGKPGSLCTRRSRARFGFDRCRK